MSGLDLFSDRFAGMPAVMAGGFNSSTKVASQSKTYPKFVKAANDLVLISAYHYHLGKLPGSESGAIYRRGNRIDELFHIDYCFVSNDSAPCATVSVLRSEYWSAVSDHYPIVLDTPDAGLSTNAKLAQVALGRGGQKSEACWFVKPHRISRREQIPVISTIKTKRA